MPGTAEAGTGEPGASTPSDPTAGRNAGAPSGADAGPPGMTQVTLRRAPRYRAFVLTGVLVGVIGAAVITFARILTVPEGYSAKVIFLYFALGLALLGGLAGAGAAVLTERRRS